MQASRLTAIGLVVAAVLWVLSGHLLPHGGNESNAASRAPEAAQSKAFRVSVINANVEDHVGRLNLSGRTEADKKVMIVARTSGILVDLKVQRGARVAKDAVIAILSDEAREAQVAQAQALFDQRSAEFEARRKLIEKGTLPRLDLNNLESQYRAAEAALAGAKAERERGTILAPWAGLVTDVPSELGMNLSPGKEIAQIVALDPMLAVVEASERKLAGLDVGKTADIRLIDGTIAQGRVRYVSKTASPTTRTYRVEVEMKNPDGKIPDGITAEVSIPLAAVPAMRVPRSALTFSSAGELGVRIVTSESIVKFVPVSLVADNKDEMFVKGIAPGSRIIVQGQDFVREGQRVEAIPYVANTAQR